MKQRGFTLVEMIVAMVLLGIVASMIAVFIRAPMVGYRDAQARGELVDAAELALRRVAREVRLALPNSVLVNGGTTLQFLLTSTGGEYQTQGAALTTGSPLVFDSTTCGDAASLVFTVRSGVPAGRQALTAGQTVVVYNLGINPANAYAGTNAAVISNVATATINTMQVANVTLNSNPFCAQNPPMPSPSNRFQVVTGTVWYVCDLTAHTLTRSFITGVNAAASPPSGATTALLASNVTNCAFNIAANASRQTATLVQTLRMQSPTNDDPFIDLTNQVHINNTP